MLTAVLIKQAKPGATPRKLFDGGGLFLLVTPAGGRLWRLKYRIDGAEKLLALGAYPDVGLAEAREAREAARKLLAQGIDPGEKKKADKAEYRAKQDNTFAATAERWFSQKSETWAPATSQKIRFYLDRDLIPALGPQPIADLRRPDLVAALKRIEARNALDVAKKCRSWLSGIFRYALVEGVIAENPATDLQVVAKAAPPHRSNPHLHASELPEFLKALAGYQGDIRTAHAIRLLLLTASRPGELRGALWDEFDLDEAVWRVPAARMKMRRPHVVPLPKQAVTLLRELRQLTGDAALVFPSRDDSALPMSDNTINGAIGRIGYKRRQTGHGFRHLVSTALNERGYNRDWIERQLAHGSDDRIRDIYNGAQYLDQRRKMMQEWADSLERAGKGKAKVVSLHAA